MSVSKIYLVGVGGQGTIAVSKIIGEAALRSEIEVVMGEVHGMAQRGGVVESTILLGGAKSPLIPNGDADILLGFEPAETLRAIRKASAKTTVVTNLRPIVPPSVSMGQASYPDLSAIVEPLRQVGKRFVGIAATNIALKIGDVRATNMAMLGALMATEELPLAVDVIQAVMADLFRQRFLEVNRTAFERGYEAARESWASV